MIRYEEEGHRYFIGEKEIPGVSAVLQASGIVDSRWYKPDSGHKGQMVHRACTLHDQNILNHETVDDEIVGYLDAWESFLFDTGAEIIGMEYIIGDAALGYAGRADRKIKLPNLIPPMVLDLKTGAAAEWHKLQVAGYARGDKYANGDEWTDLAVGTLYLKKTGKYKLETMSALSMATYVHQFVELVHQYHLGEDRLW